MTMVLLVGVGLWAAGTVTLRAVGDGLLRAGAGSRAIGLYAGSFVAMALVAPALFYLLGLPGERWFEAVALLTLPTLLLDPFSCLFFTRVFPNIAPGAAGVFGGWMLISCAGAIAGVWIAR